MTILSDEDVSNLYVVWHATEGASHADLIRATERKVLRLAELADAQAEIARLRGALEKCSTALYLAAPFADGCNVEDALTIEVGRAAARELLK